MKKKTTTTRRPAAKRRRVSAKKSPPPAEVSDAARILGRRASRQVEIHVFPHVIHVQIDGEEVPARRVPIPTDEAVAQLRADLFAEFRDAEIPVRRFTETGVEIIP